MHKNFKSVLLPASDLVRQPRDYGKLIDSACGLVEDGVLIKTQGRKPLSFYSDYRAVDPTKTVSAWILGSYSYSDIAVRTYISSYWFFRLLTAVADRGRQYNC